MPGTAGHQGLYTPDDLAKELKESLTIEDDYDCNWHGIVDCFDIRAEDGWHSTLKKERTRKQIKKEIERQNLAAATKSLEEDDYMDEYLQSFVREQDQFDEYFEQKKACKDKHSRRVDSRSKYNMKRAALIRKKKNKSGKKDINPHSAETDFVNLVNETEPQVQPVDDELSELLGTISEVATDDGMNEWISYLENIVIMAYQVSKSKTFTEVFVAIVAYIKMHTGRSITQDLLKIVNTMTSFEEPDIEPHGLTGASVLNSWELLKTNTIFTKVSFLITAAMSLSVCKMKEIEFSMFGLKLLSLEAAKKQVDAKDVIDAAIQTFTWIAQTGYRVFKEGSLAPLLYSDHNVRDFNRDCDYVLAHAESCINGNGEDLNDFEFKVDRALEQVSALKRAKDNAITGMWLQSRYSQLVHIKEQIICKRRNTAIRFAPFGIGLRGSSGVGKSTLSKLVMKVALHAMGFDPDPKRIITKDMFDQYDSTYTSDILGMFMDDVGNGKSEFAKVSPTDIIIKFFNNMAAQAVKAELNAKGVVFIDFKVGVISSNFEDYNVRQYTEKPEATLRRFIHTTVNIKPEYRKPGSVSLDTDHPDLIEGDLTKDVWQLDLEYCHIIEGKKGKDKYSFKTLEVDLDGEHIVCSQLDLKTYLRVIVHLAKKHAANQQRVIARSNEFDAMAMDPETSLPMSMVKPQAFEAIGEVIVGSAVQAAHNYMCSWFTPLNFVNSLLGFSPIRKMTTKTLINEMSQVLDDTVTPAMIAVTPEFIFQTSLFQRMIKMWHTSAVLYDMKKNIRRVGLLTLCGLLHGVWSANLTEVVNILVLAWIATMILWSQYRARVRLYREEFLQRRDVLPESIREIRDSKLTQASMLVGTLVVGLKLFNLWNKQRLAKVDKNEIRENAAVSDDGVGWLSFLASPIVHRVLRQKACMTTTAEQLVGVLKQNQWWAEFHRPDGSIGRCSVIFPRKSVVWFPLHMFYKGADMSKESFKTLTVVAKKEGKGPGTKLTFVVELDTCATNEHLDLVAAYVPNCPDIKSLEKYLPTELPKGNLPAIMRCRLENEIDDDSVNVRCKQEGHRYRDFYGGRYYTSMAKNGACMSPIVLNENGACIIGFHIGGDNSASLGVMQTILLSDYEAMNSQLENFGGVILSAHSGEIPKTQYDRPLTIGPLHEKSVFNDMEDDDYVEPIGSTCLRSNAVSSVRQSVISESVAKHTGVENKWGAPKLQPNWKGFNATLEHIKNPTSMFAPSEVERARLDWLEPLIPLMRTWKDKDNFAPLSDHESVMGVSGKSFLTPLPMSTGMGFPVFGPKKKHFEESKMDNGEYHREPSEEVWTEINRLKKCWENNERGYPVTTATLKDEPTPLDKDKVRVFQAGPVAMSFWIRKYFLPVARFLGMHSVESECAVGVNAYSHGWKELMDHAEKYADDNKMIAWDYSKYDVRMNAQITRAVWVSFIELAKVGGYPEEDLRIMKAMIADIVHPLIDWNGTMMMCYNMNTSGNNLTVNVNSSAGSIYVRLGFFHEYPEATSFRNCVAAMTYGDDFIGSVHKDYRNFGFLSFKKMLAEHDMKVTLPDKSDNEVDFLEKEDVDFLKRKSQYIPEIDATIGKLDEMSIFKSLHSNLISKTVTAESVSMDCIHGAMHEWFAHGRETYELRRAQMAEVCKDMNWILECVELSYDDMAYLWKNKYCN